MINILPWRNAFISCYRQRLRSSLLLLTMIIAINTCFCLIIYQKHSYHVMQQGLNQIERPHDITILLSSHSADPQITLAKLENQLQTLVQPQQLLGVQESWQQLNNEPSSYFAHLRTSSHFSKARHLEIAYGRDFHPLDRPSQYFCLIGHDVAKIFQQGRIHQWPITLQLGTETFQVIGILKPSTQTLGWTNINRSIITLLHPHQQLQPPRYLLINTHHYSTETLLHHLQKHFPKQHFEQRSSTLLRNSIMDNYNKINNILVSISILSGLVAACAVLQNMFAHTAERRHELGLRVTLGAQAKDIGWLFFYETWTICMISFIISIPLSYQIHYMISAAIHLPLLSLYQQLHALAMSTIGITCIASLATLYPAYCAAHTPPLQLMK